MSLFVRNYRTYIRNARQGLDSEFSLKTLAQVEPILAFLYNDWWKVEPHGLQHLPKQGPVLLVGNCGGVLPWAGIMLLYALMKDKEHPRRLNILADLDWIDDERLYTFLRGIGFSSFSYDNAKRLFEAGEIVLIFPEGLSGAIKPFGERYRLRAFDWTKLMPAIEMNVPVIPVATLGPDESFPIGKNWENMARLLSLPAFPVTPFFPWLPFPLNLFSLPVKWKLRVMKPLEYTCAQSREELQETSKRLALFAEGEAQAELNRLLRMRIKSLF